MAIKFLNTVQVDTDVLYVDASSNRVGIGTTTPSTDLEVSSTGVNGVDISQSASNASQSGRLFFTTNTASEGFALFNSNGTFQVNSGGIPNNTSGTNRISIIGSSGNVGIGTTSPDVKLEVESTASASGIRIKNTNSGFASLDIESNRGTGSNLGGLRYKKTGQSFSQAEINYVAGTRFDFLSGSGTSAPTQKLSILNNGDVGIGTNSPSELLHLSSTGPARLLIEADTDNITETDNAQIILKQDGGAVVGNLGYKTNTNSLEITNNYAAADGILTLGTSGIERMRIDYLGNVGIGTTSPRSKLQVEGVTGSVPALGAAASAAQIGGSTYGTLFSTLTSGTGVIQQGRSDGVTLTFPLLINPNGGNVGIGTTSPNSKLHVAGTVSHSTPLANFNGSVGSGVYGTVSVRVDNINYGTAMKFYRSSTADNNAIGFQNGASTVGSISIGTSSTSYNTTSDYRLKENLTAITDGIYRLKQLKPRRFNFIGNADVVDGFIAHEAKEVIPESVTGEKDEVLPNGDPVYQGIDQAKIVPLLTAALQEAISKIEQLETRIQTLENK